MTTRPWILAPWFLITLLLAGCSGVASEGGVPVDDSAALGETEQALTSCNVPFQALCSTWLGDAPTFERTEAGCPEGATSSTEACPTVGAFGQCALSSAEGEEMRTTYYAAWPTALRPSLSEACVRGGGQWIAL